MGLRVCCSLISSRDNALLCTLLGPECSAVASGVAQVYVASMEPGDHGASWRCKGSGVVCLVNDQSLMSYFLRLYSIKRAKLLWEQELYTPFRYSAPRPFFHTFPADDFQAGLNFADEDEAERFLSAVETQIKSARDEERKAFNDSPSSPAQMTLAHALNPSSAQFFWSTLNKSDTKLPSNFNLMNYASKNPEKNFDVNILDPAQQKLFAKAGISEADLKDKQVSRFYTTVEHQGGLEAVQKDSQSPQPQTLRKGSGASSSLALRKGPLPPLPPQSGLHPGRKPCSVPYNISNQPFSATPLTHDAIPPPPSHLAPTIPPGHPTLTQLSASNR
ncbi:hypothetical protein SKAU_G00105990 [Synaphobranchus kaupii]|uniref:WH1 domain-containing protein n=1 Tax=Synaphobranchus kaupii TaxID=118154 RepID=A0A9Q1FZI2_SYNKA|nr:hypothetical protein SKAU_G00105990 [Synaphobranchus kaupii]